MTLQQDIAPAPSPTDHQLRRPTLLESLARRQTLRVMRQLQHGEIVVHEGAETICCGQRAEDGLTAEITVHDPHLYGRILQQGSLGAAESYLQGEWSSPDLVAVFRILCRNMDRLTALESGAAQIGNWFAWLTHRRSDNTKSGSQRNIAAHYDLSNEFFQLFLDETMMYSSGYFTSADLSMTEASLAKIDLVCRKLKLGPDDHVLEIGTGWGGFAKYAAENYGCRVTTTTISSQQHDFAKQRFEDSGLTDRVSLLQSDYRDLTGSYDKLVSIEMIEAVGAKFLPQFFAKCESLLKPGGQMLVQAILMPDHRYDRYCQAVDFIQKYIFPGGHLPSVSALQAALAKDTQLRLAGFEEFAESYARTLRAWRDLFIAKLEQVEALGFDERFVRMWDYYLCYCEGAFWEQATSVGQFVWQKAAY